MQPDISPERDLMLWELEQMASRHQAARRVAVEAMRLLSDTQLAVLRERLDQLDQIER